MMSDYGVRSISDDTVAAVPRRYRITVESDLGRVLIEATSCPDCGAELGLPCVDLAGEPLEIVHDARADAYDDGLLTAIEAMAGIAQRATEERDQLIVRAVEAGLSTRQVGAAAGMTHTAVQYIVRRRDPPD